MVVVAQLVESRIVIPVVVGSSPISHPNWIWNWALFQVLNFLVSQCCYMRQRTIATYHCSRILIYYNFIV